MKKLQIAIFGLGLALAGLAGVMSANAALTWNFNNAADYYVSGDSGTTPLYTSYLPVITVGVGAYVPARPWINSDDNAPYGSDWAAVFAKVNTQATGLKVGDITGGGFTVSGMNHPDAVYGSLYLSPSGGSGSTVLINMSPMGITGSDGNLTYTFGLNTVADVMVSPTGDWGSAQYTGTFGGAIAWINASAYSDTYAAFFGPQIGMSGTSGTTFTVSEIQLVPEPTTTGCFLLGLGALACCQRFAKNRRS